MSKPKPDCGVWHDVPADEYHSWPCVSNSWLGRMAISPAHYRTAESQPETPAMAIGTLTHTVVLEPTEVARLYAVEPEWHKDEANVTARGERTNSKATSYVKQQRAKFEEANRGRRIVSAAEYDRIAAMANAVYRDEAARDCLQGDCLREVSIVWDDPDTGLRCKARLDTVNKTNGRYADLKTTADLAKFPTSIARYGYHRQAVHYCEGWEILTGERLEPWLVAVEKEPPFCVQAAPLCEEGLRLGWDERRELLDRVAECQASGDWPGPAAPAA